MAVSVVAVTEADGPAATVFDGGCIGATVTKSGATETTVENYETGKRAWRTNSEFVQILKVFLQAATLMQRCR